MTKKEYDKIHIRDLQVRCIVGIYEEERRAKQDVFLNITLYADYRDACLSDRIEDTVDYKTVKNQIVELVDGSSYFLIERLAESVADICLKPPRVHGVTVSVDKPGALRFARSVAVEITRMKNARAT